MTKLYFRLSLTRDADPLQALSTNYHGLGIEAHILELYSNSVGTFTASSSKPYFLDPALYRFFTPFFSDCKDKRWAAKLIERYGLEDAIQEYEDGLVPDAFAPAAGALKEGATTVNSKKLVSTILEYQRGRIPEIGNGSAVWDALEQNPSSLLAPGDFSPPEVLLAPYLIIDKPPVLQLATKFASEALAVRQSGEKLYLTMAFLRDYLSSPASLDKLRTTLGALKSDGLMLWVCDFKENQEDSVVLEAFARFAYALRRDQPERSLVNLFGGFFSVVLSARGLLDGMVQGVGISEKRDPYASGGGGISRYYLPVSRQSVSTELAADLKQVSPTVFGCVCSVCSTKPNPATLDINELARHFILTRSKELEWAGKSSPSQISNVLIEDSKKLYEIHGSLGGIAGEHARRLEVWGSVIQNLAGSGVIQ